MIQKKCIRQEKSLNSKFCAGVSVSCTLRRNSSRVAHASGEGRSSFWRLRVAQECMAWHAGLSGFSSV
ncbi:hypothetical protein A2U01_0091551, partial [Trifolium medium]|nr:hypothetical protein [Trifolium medium]